MKKTSLILFFDKIGCGSEKENERVPFFFDKTGCTCRFQNEVRKNHS